MARFANGKAPFLRSSDEPNKGTKTIMRDFIIGLIPVILFAWYKNGISVYLRGDCSFMEMLYPLFFIIIGGLLSYLFEAIFFYVTDPKVRTIKAMMKKQEVSFSLIPGLLLALILPLYTPIWVLMFGIFMSTIVAKMLFGGFGNNIFNPALIGRIAIAFTLIGVVSAAGGYLNPSEVLVDSYAGATPLAVLSDGKVISYSALVAPYGSLWHFFFGNIPGAIGETGAFFIIISYIWLAYRKVIKWFTPLVYVATVFVLTWAIGMVNGDAGIWFPLYGIFSGGLMFGAVFMATEPVTSPKNPLGKFVFALFLGALTVLFRYIGVLPEGVATSIVVMNIFTMPIDRSTAIIRSTGVTKATLPKVLFISFLLLAIMVYAVIKSTTMYNLSLIFIGSGI